MANDEDPWELQLSKILRVMCAPALDQSMKAQGDPCQPLLPVGLLACLLHHGLKLVTLFQEQAGQNTSLSPSVCLDSPCLQSLASSHLQSMGGAELESLFSEAGLFSMKAGMPIWQLAFMTWLLLALPGHLDSQARSQGHVCIRVGYPH